MLQAAVTPSVMNLSQGTWWVFLIIQGVRGVSLVMNTQSKCLWGWAGGSPEGVAGTRTGCKEEGPTLLPLPKTPIKLLLALYIPWF